MGSLASLVNFRCTIVCLNIHTCLNSILLSEKKMAFILCLQKKHYVFYETFDIRQKSSPSCCQVRRSLTHLWIWHVRRLTFQTNAWLLRKLQFWPEVGCLLIPESVLIQDIIFNIEATYKFWHLLLIYQSEYTNIIKCYIVSWVYEFMKHQFLLFIFNREIY